MLAFLISKNKTATCAGTNGLKSAMSKSIARRQAVGLFFRLRYVEILLARRLSAAQVPL